MAGEYVDNRLFRAGWGSGGTGSLHPGFDFLPAFVVEGVVCLDFCCWDCLFFPPATGLGWGIGGSLGSGKV